MTASAGFSTISADDRGKRAYVKNSKLIVTIPGEPDTELELADRLTIGRSTSNNLCLPDQNASRRHAEIRSTGKNRHRVFDVGSSNGTWVNGRRLTVPKDLDEGDQVVIGNIIMRYVAGTGEEAVEEEEDDTLGPGMFATAVAMRNEQVIILVSDIRNYTGMSEKLPAQNFSNLVSEWFRESTAMIEKHGGVIDKFIGDAVMSYWNIKNSTNPSKEANSALDTATEMIAVAETFSRRLEAEFEGHTFRVGIGINMGDAIFGNVGTSSNQSFTIVGDCVNVAFRLETVSKEKKQPVIVSRNVCDIAESRFSFLDLGAAEVKGRKEPVPIMALVVPSLQVQ